MAYVELHARSAFSFLRGGSAPERLAREGCTVIVADVNEQGAADTASSRK